MRRGPGTHAGAAARQAHSLILTVSEAQHLEVRSVLISQVVTLHKLQCVIASSLESQVGTSQ